MSYYYQPKCIEKDYISTDIKIICENDFYKIIDNKCYICGKKNKMDESYNNIHKNGIDRFNNTEGYTLTNSKSCCSTCNYMKKNYEYENFINKYNHLNY